jgi:L-lactate dehydrogenase complex protein LldG
LALCKKRDPVSEFKRNAESVSAMVSKIGDLSEVPSYIRDIINERRVRAGEINIAVTQLNKPEIKKLYEIFAGLTKVRIVKERMADFGDWIDIGITFADYGISETGTLVMDSRDNDIRLSSMIVNTHVVILPVSRIKMTMDELSPELNNMLKEESSYVSFITGASRTADIERVLILGVHGPLELHILLLDDLSG